MIINKLPLRLSLFILLTGSYTQRDNIYATSQKDDIERYQTAPKASTKEKVSSKSSPWTNCLLYYQRIIFISFFFSLTLLLTHVYSPKENESDPSPKPKKSETPQSDPPQGNKSNITEQSEPSPKENESDPSPKPKKSEIPQSDPLQGNKSNITEQSKPPPKENESDPFPKPKKSEAPQSNPPKSQKTKYVLNLNKKDIKYEILPEDLQATYNISWGDKQDENLQNSKLKLEGDDGIIEKLAKQLADFEDWKKKGNWNMFFSSHYDWWVFPTPYKSSSCGMDYVVYKKDINKLRNHIYQGKLSQYRGRKYVDLQRKASELVLESMGWWDPEKKEITGRCTKEHTAVRRGKMMHGLLIWHQDLYKVMNALTLALEKVNLPLKNDFKKYITRAVKK